jgi:NADPH:quinone reductase-like Zn-dependent oxidoreductase
LKSIDALSFRTLPSVDLGPKEIEIRVESAGLNFKDILNIIKPDDQFKNSDMVAADISGVVVAVGSEVRRWSVGSSVIGFNPNQFVPLPTHIISQEDLFTQLPDNFTFSDGATLPTVFVTAYHSLVEIANLQRRETILIHTASGGVGLCAIQVARHLGANIIVTAGSKRKRAYLREIIGCEHVFHSRNLRYKLAEKILFHFKSRFLLVLEMKLLVSPTDVGWTLFSIL